MRGVKAAAGLDTTETTGAHCSRAHIQWTGPREKQPATERRPGEWEAQGIASSVRARLAGSDRAGSEGTKTEEFYTTLATYPFLHLSANAPARLPVLHKMCGALDLSRKVDDTAPASPHSATDEALRERVRTAITSQDAVSAHLGGLKDYMEGRALMEMERCAALITQPSHRQPLAPSLRCSQPLIRYLWAQNARGGKQCCLAACLCRAAQVSLGASHPGHQDVPPAQAQRLHHGPAGRPGPHACPVYCRQGAS